MASLTEGISAMSRWRESHGSKRARTPERRAQSGWWEWFDGLARTLSDFPRRGTLGAGGGAKIVGGFGGGDRLKDGRAWSDMMDGMDAGDELAQRTL